MADQLTPDAPRPLSIVSDGEWWAQRAQAVFDAGEHIPVNWGVQYDHGDDGCMPRGWYATGLNAGGWSIDWPVRHEYGPFDTEEQAILCTRYIDSYYAGARHDAGGGGGTSDD